MAISARRSLELAEKQIRAEREAQERAAEREQETAGEVEE